MAKRIFDDKTLIILKNDTMMDDVTLDIVEQAGIQEVENFLQDYRISYKIGIMSLFYNWIKENPDLLDTFKHDVKKKNESFVDSTRFDDCLMAKEICSFSVLYVATEISYYVRTFNKASKLIEAILNNIYKAFINGQISKECYNQTFINFCLDIVKKTEESFERNGLII